MYLFIYRSHLTIVSLCQQFLGVLFLSKLRKKWLKKHICCIKLFISLQHSYDSKVTTNNTNVNNVL